MLIVMFKSYCCFENSSEKEKEREKSRLSDENLWSPCRRGCHNNAETEEYIQLIFFFIKVLEKENNVKIKTLSGFTYYEHDAEKTYLLFLRSC